MTWLAAFLHARARIVLAVVAVGAVLAAAFGSGVVKRLSPYSADDPATQSVQATDRFQAASHRQIEPGVVALVSLPGSSFTSAQSRARVERVAAQLRAEPNVAAVTDYYTTGDRGMVSRDGRQTYINVYFKPVSDTALQDEAKTIQADFAAQHDVKLGGVAVANVQVNTQVSNDLAKAELMAFPLIFLLSLLFFRSLVATLLTPLLGALSIVFTLLGLRVVSGFVDLSVFAVNLVIGLSLGLAIDYSLLIISRYREEAAVEGFGVGALRRTMASAGRTVLFSSVTVSTAVASLVIFPQRFLYSMGIAGAIVPLSAAALSLTALPAMLAILGPRVNALAPRRLARAADREARPATTGAWYGLSRFVMRRPARIAIASAVALVALGIPFAGIKFAAITSNEMPAAATARQVDDTLTERFPANRTEPVDVIAGAPAHSAELRALSKRISRLPDVAAVAPAQSGGPEMTLLSVDSKQASTSQATKQLVHDIRALQTPYYLGVAGATAAYLDLESSLGAHLPLVVAWIVLATVIVLFVMTGSIVLPVKAVLMNTLSLSAVFGLLVLFFQDGWLSGLLGFRAQGALDATQPIMIFAIGFGLATDYGVFLLSRIKQAHDEGASNSEAVAMGLERTGRIVSVAALLFAIAIGAFVTSKLVFIKELGFGTALSVLIDASVVRALLVPSLMQLLGSANWWAPRPLRRIHARLVPSDHLRPTPAASN